MKIRKIFFTIFAILLIFSILAQDSFDFDSPQIFWDNPESITSSDTRFPKSICQNGKFLVFFQEIDSAKKTFAVSLCSKNEREIVWSKAKKIAGPFVYSGDVPDAFSVSVNSSGTIALAVQTSPRTIGIFESSDSGNSFSETEFDEQEKAVVAPRIFAGKNGEFALFASLGEPAESGSAGSFAMLYARKSGGIWSPLKPFLPSLKVNAPFVPFLIQHNSEEIVVFQGLAQNSNIFQLFVSKSVDSGQSWSDAVQITEIGSRNQRPALASDGGKIYISWERSATSSDRAQIMAGELLENLSIKDEYEVTKSGRGNAHRPLFFDFRGNISLVWFDDRSGDDSVYFARKSGVFWEEFSLPAGKGFDAQPLVSSAEIAFSFERAQKDGTSRVFVLERDKKTAAPSIIAKSFEKGKRSTSEKASAQIKLPDDPSGIAGWTWIWTKDEDENPPKDESAIVPPKKIDLDGIAKEDGRYFFKARALDNAGNWSEAAVLEYHRDLTPPSPPVIDKIETDEFGFPFSNDFSASWQADANDDDVAGWTWNLTPIKSIPKELAVNKTHPMRLSESQVEEKVSSLLLSATRPNELQKWHDFSRPPRKIMGRENSAQFKNEPNGLFVLSVAGIDTVGNIGDASDVFVILNKFIPETKILSVSQKTDERGVVEISIAGEGFLYDGTISEIFVKSGDNSYSFKKSSGDFVVESDEKISGIRLRDMKAGNYSVSVRHTDRGLKSWSGSLKILESGAVVTANNYSFENSWKILEEESAFFNFPPVPAILAVFLSVCSVILCAFGLISAAKDASILKQEISAMFQGGEMPQEKKIALSKKGRSLKVKLFGFTTILVVSVVLVVAVSLGTRMSQTQERTLLEGLQDRVNVVMESMASDVRNYLPEAKEKTNEIMLIPTKTKYFTEANWATVTGLPLDNSNLNLDFVWSSNDPLIDEKIDSEEFVQGQARLKNADERIFSLAKPLNDEAASQVREISAKMEAIRAEKAGADAKRNSELNAFLAELRGEIDSRLNELSADSAGSIPHFSARKLDKEQQLYTFYKPVLFRISGDNDTFVRAFLLMEVSTDTVRTEIENSIREIIVISVIAAIFAIIIGDIAAFALASVIVKPIQRLVLYVKKIGDTADKEELDGEEIKIKTRDEIRTLGDAVNEMTRGLVKAAKDEKVAAKIREENIRTREAAAKAQAEAAEAQARVLEEQEKALEAQKMNMDGKSVQNALIPLNAGRETKQTTASYCDKEIDLFCYYEGSDDVSGDFFDYKKLDERWYAVIKCDVSGHGIPAALLVAVIATIFREYFSDWSFKKNGTRINELAGKLNEFIGNLGLRGKFATLLIGLFDSKNDEVYLCHAGDRIVRIFDAEKKEQKTIELDSAASGMPAAGQIEQWMVDMKGGYKVRKLKLKKNDILFLYTDGIEEAQSVFKDANFNVRKCGETKNLDKDGKHINHMPDETYEEFGNDRIKDIVECVFNKRKYTLKRCHAQNPREVLEFNLSKCKNSTEDMILALASIEKIFRIFKKPSARGNVTKDDKGNIRIDGDGIRVDRKIDEFLSKTFNLYDFYCRDKIDLGEQNYVYYVNVNEDKQADDLTIFAVKNL